MPTVQFAGRVLPATHPFSFWNIPRVNWELKEINLVMTFAIHVDNGAVTVQCEINRLGVMEISQLYRRALDLSRVAADAVSFASGIGFTVHLERISIDGSDPKELVFRQPDVEGLCTAYSLSINGTPEQKQDVTGILTLLMTEPPLYMALNDLIQQLLLPHSAGINCGRMLDGLKKIVGPAMNDKAGWLVLQEAIRADAAYLKFISDNSTKPRHGDRTMSNDAITAEAIKRSWIIMNRFLIYRKRGSYPLPAVEFPILLG